MTQEQLAEIIGVSREYLGRLERGQNSVSVDMAIALSDTFGVTVDEILAIERNKNKVIDDLTRAIVKVLDENKLFSKSVEMGPDGS